jgi:type IV secretory pathway TraG/TraD family ATPase VirD4
VAAATQSRGSRRFISDLGGEATVRWERHSSSGAKLQPIQPRENRSTAETKRPLITQGEVGTLGADEILIAKTGMPLIRARKRFYFKDRDLAARAAIRPPKRAPRPGARERRASSTSGRSTTPAPERATPPSDPATSRGGRERGERGR